MAAAQSIPTGTAPTCTSQDPPTRAITLVARLAAAINRPFAALAHFINHTTAPGRGIRVLVMVAAIIAMGLTDLYLTTLHLTTIGMAEANPLARLIIQQDCATVLALWKMATLLPCTLVLCKHRSLAISELAAIAGCVAMGVVMFHWQAYAAQVDLIQLSLAELQAGFDDRWVSLTPRN